MRHIDLFSVLNKLMINIIDTYKLNYNNRKNILIFSSKIDIKLDFFWHIKNLETNLSILLNKRTFYLKKIFYFGKIDLLYT